MNSGIVIFSPRAKQRLEGIADYLYQQDLSNAFVLDYLARIESWLDAVLGQFPESGILLPEYGEGIRKVVYMRYSFLYRINGDMIEILTVYRENLP